MHCTTFWQLLGAGQLQIAAVKISLPFGRLPLPHVSIITAAPVGKKPHKWQCWWTEAVLFLSSPWTGYGYCNYLTKAPERVYSNGGTSDFSKMCERRAVRQHECVWDRMCVWKRETDPGSAGTLDFCWKKTNWKDKAWNQKVLFTQQTSRTVVGFVGPPAVVLTGFILPPLMLQRKSFKCG